MNEAEQSVGLESTLFTNDLLGIPINTNNALLILEARPLQPTGHQASKLSRRVDKVVNFLEA